MRIESGVFNGGRQWEIEYGSGLVSVLFRQGKAEEGGMLIYIQMDRHELDAFTEALAFAGRDSLVRG